MEHGGKFRINFALLNLKHIFLIKLITFQPVEMTDWEIQVEFKVHGVGKDLFGDGFVIWYARDRNELGKTFI